MAEPYKMAVLTVRILVHCTECWWDWAPSGSTCDRWESSREFPAAVWWVSAADGECRAWNWRISTMSVKCWWSRGCQKLVQSLYSVYY